MAISTCPNDTFAFHAILNRKIDLRGLEFSIELLDIQELNAGLLEGRFDVAKASFHAALHLGKDYWVLPSGSALGFGVGPLLLAARDGESPADGPGSMTLCPGEQTTAHLLFRLFYGGEARVEQVVFSEIMPRLQQGTADFGVCIHEGRFTWQQEGLFCVEDLGTRWESATGTPLPLGGLLIRRDLDPDRAALVQQVIRESIEYGLAHRAETAATMHRYAQELDERVLFQHVDLYVNEWTVDLGETGRQALATLAREAQRAGLTSQRALEVLPV